MRRADLRHAEDPAAAAAAGGDTTRHLHLQGLD